jgi:hypothetical protein
MRLNSRGNTNAQKYKRLSDVLSNTKTTLTGCAEWQGAINKDGYAACNVGGIFRGQLLHREVFRLAINKTPSVVMHTCDNRKCINPAHLRAGSPQANVRDMDQKGRRVVYIKFLPEQVSAMLSARKAGVPEKVVCAEFGVSRGYLWKLKSGWNRRSHADY